MEPSQLLRDPDIEPTNAVIAQALGTANNAYLKFVEALAHHDMQLEWRYYHDGKAWLAKGLYKWTTSRGTPKETTAFWLSIWDGFFKVTVYVPEKARADAQALPLDDDIKDMIGNAKQIGKLKFFPLLFDMRSDAQFDAVFTLVDFKKLLK